MEKVPIDAVETKLAQLALMGVGVVLMRHIWCVTDLHSGGWKHYAFTLHKYHTGFDECAGGIHFFLDKKDARNY